MVEVVTTVVAEVSSKIPAMRDASGAWVFDAQEEANLFADGFASKFGLPDIEVNDFRAIAPAGDRT